MKKSFVLAVGFVFSFFAVSPVFAQDWGTVGYINHSTYQAVNPDGSTAYSGGFPVKFVGVVLNNNENWLSSASSSTGIGGQAEVYVQAVNLDGTAYDTSGAAYNDFGGTSCWIGQNYGVMHSGDPSYNYTSTQWYAELDRIGMWYDGSTLEASQLVRAGDLIEIRVRAGLNYKGKYNVNEQHNNDSSYDYEIVILQKGYGLPDSAKISLSALKTSANAFIFDSTRQSGGELYQSSLVELLNVEFTSVAGWGQNGDFTVTDGSGRTHSVHLGFDDAFDSMIVPELGQRFNITGILDQASTSGVYGTDGYRLLVMDASNLVAVPEPAGLTILTAVAAWFYRRKKQ